MNKMNNPAIKFKDKNDVPTWPFPEYEEIVEKFFQTASKECWTDYDYTPEKAGQMLENENIIENADISQIKTMLTFCVRGERFCDGHWAEMIENGNI